MNYILKPSLEHVCLTKIVVQLWTANEDNQHLAYNTSFSEYYCCDSNDFAKMKEKIDSLPLPTRSKSHLLNFIKPIGVQIYHWYEYLNENYKVKAINVKDLRWTSLGTIDQGKSIQLLLERDQSLSLKQRYRLACTFCLVEQVQEILRKEILKDERLPALAYSSLVPANDQDLVVYFTQRVTHQRWIINRFPATYLSPYHEACHAAIVSRNSVATEYFFQRLNREEKNLIFSAFRVQFREIHYLAHFLASPIQIAADLVCFLLSQMSETQREETLRTSALGVLNCLVAWPYAREFLLETVRQMKEFPRESDFDDLVYEILAQLDKSVANNCEYRAMFFELWRLSPVQHRTYFVDRLKMKKLYDYFNDGGVEICKLILSEASAGRKERIILEEQSFPRYMYNIFASRKLRNYFRFFIEECGTSREVMVRFKSQLTAHAAYVDNEESREFLQFLDTFHPQQQTE